MSSMSAHWGMSPSHMWSLLMSYLHLAHFNISSSGYVKPTNICSSTKVRTRFRTFASRKFNHASILLTNLVKSYHYYSIVQTPTNNFFQRVICYLRIIPAKLSRSAKQHPSNSAHLMRRFVRGLSIYVYQFVIPTDFRTNSRRVPRVGHVWLAQAHAKAYRTPPST
jgi:hypothetical protein